MIGRSIDPCPACGVNVREVAVQMPVARAQPCGHRVVATVWPDRVQLTLPDTPPSASTP